MYQSNAYVLLVQNYWSSLKFTENLWLEIFKNFQIVTASGSSHHINLSLFLCLFLKLWNFAKIEPGLKWNFLPVELQTKGPKMTVTESYRYRKITVILSQMGKNRWRSQSILVWHGEYQSYTKYSMSDYQRSGAAEACWAHNPKVGGSKPSSAISISG